MVSGAFGRKQQQEGQSPPESRKELDGLLRTRPALILDLWRRSRTKEVNQSSGKPREERLSLLRWASAWHISGRGVKNIASQEAHLQCQCAEPLLDQHSVKQICRKKFLFTGTNTVRPLETLLGRIQGRVGGTVYYLLPSPPFRYLSIANTYLPKDSSLILIHFFPYSLLLPFPPTLTDPSFPHERDNDWLENRFSMFFHE